MRVRQRQRRDRQDAHNHDNVDQSQGEGTDYGAPAASTGTPVPRTRAWDYEEFIASGADLADGVRANFGAVWIPVANDMEVRLEVDEQSQTVTGMIIALDGSTMKLIVCAAPRSGGMWQELRADIAQELRDHGGSAYEQDGPLGRELSAQLPPDPQGQREAGQAARFVGIEGPRWLVQAIILGQAATDPQAAQVMEVILREMVIQRGDMALPRGALLPITPPEQPGQQEQAFTSAQQASPYQQGDLNPFQRGPEITETR